MHTFVIHGKTVVRRNGHWYAIKKPMDIAERIHHRQSPGDASFARQMTKPAIKVRNTRSIRG